MNIPLCDIDEFSFISESIHCVGGQIGQTLIILDQILRKLAEDNVFTNDSVKIPEFIENFLEEFLLNQLKEGQYLKMNYLESQKFDFSDVPLEDAKRKEYHEFILDDRRFVNKSIKLLLEKEILTEYIYRSFLENIAKLVLSLPITPNTIEMDSENQDDEYIKLIENKNIQIERENKKLEKMKKKIKLNFIKPEDLKKKRDNIGGFVTILSNKHVVESMIEIEERLPEISEKIKEPENQNLNNEINQQIEESKNDENLPKDRPSNDESIPKEKLNNEENQQKTENLENLIEVLEPLKIKLDYVNEVDVFKNSSLPIDTYMLHYDMTQGYIAYTLRSIKRVLSKNYKVNIDLNVWFDSINQKCNEINNNIYEHVMKNEKYLGKSIIPIEVKPELPQENAEFDLNTAST